MSIMYIYFFYIYDKRIKIKNRMSDSKRGKLMGITCMCFLLLKTHGLYCLKLSYIMHVYVLNEVIFYHMLICVQVHDQCLDMHA